MNIKDLRKYLQEFKLGQVFNELGWENPSNPRISSLKNGTITSRYQEIATLGGVKVFQIENETALTNKNLRKSFHKEITKLAFEHLIIFTDKLDAPAQSLWYWVKRDGKKEIDRDHLFVKGQTGDLFISKIIGMFVDISDLDERGNLPVTEAVKRLGDALDVEKVTKKFYKEFDAVRLEFRNFITGIENEKDKAHYASVLLHRLMFIYFLQAKGFLDTKSGDNGNRNYLNQKLEAYKTTNFYQDFLKDLFFEGFAKPPETRAVATQQKLGHIKYLNGGLFLAHRIELENQNIEVQNQAFSNLFKLFSDYSWNLDDTPEGKDNEINPDVLGYIFEKYINNKAYGAYYTRPEITEYLCKQTIHQLILEKVNVGRGVVGLPQKKFNDLPEMLLKLDANLCTELLEQVLPKLKLLDPACGSGAFLIAALKTLTDIYGAILGRIDILNDPYLNNWKKKQQGNRSTFTYVVKRRIVTDNLFGVDLMPEATDIARLRLFLAMVSSAKSVEDLEPLPNIDFNILSGNSLIGLMHVDTEQYKQANPIANMFSPDYPDIIKQRLIDLNSYRHSAELGIADLQGLRDNLQNGRTEALKVLNPMLYNEFVNFGIKFEAATWDTSKNKEGKTKKRHLELTDILSLEPFHWGFEFSEVMEQGGFDAIIANPPWDILKPQDKEFFAEYSDVVTKNKMTIKEFEKEKDAILSNNPEVQKAYLDYLSRFPYQSAYFRTTKQFTNQSSLINGKKTGTDINLYKLFLEQCHNLLRSGGQCGIVIPSGIYTDLGAKGLREMLFEQTTITGLFGFENRKTIFEGVDSRFKFVVLSFAKAGSTTNFPATFMRLDVSDLERFPDEIGIEINVKLVKRLSPDSMSIMEFKSDLDKVIAEKMVTFPLLGEQLNKTWNLKLTREFDTSNDKELLHDTDAKGRILLLKGRMFNQFEMTDEKPSFWITEKEGRLALLGKEKDSGQKLDYQSYRWVHRDIARNTDSRTFISTIAPKLVFTNETSPTLKVVETNISDLEMLFFCSVCNSFTLDWLVRKMVTSHVKMYNIYQLPVPRLTTRDPHFKPIITRAAKLICTTPEFDELAKSAGLRSHTDGATIPTERAKLRAELDGLIAHLYGLTESEFAHILETFPLVTEGVRLAALNAYQDVRNGLIK
jgi:Alw26I/Eco31I/Esp3I family type II restriction m6 adenine DNA methyltransferase